MSFFLFVQYRISMIFLLIFLLACTPLRFKKIPSVFIAAACFFLTGVCDYMAFFIVENTILIGVTLFEIIVVQLTAFFLNRYSDFRALFTGFLSAAYVLFGNAVGSIVYVCYPSVWISLLAQILTHAFLLVVFLYSMRDRYLDELKENTFDWKLLCLVPALLYAVIYSLTIWPENIYKTPGLAFCMIPVLLLMVISCFLLAALFDRHREEAGLKQKNESLKTYANCIRREAEAIQESERQMTIFRHDLRHGAALISAYLDAGETEKIRKFLSKINSELSKIQAVRYCENIAVNGIISSYVQRAKQAQVLFLCETTVPAQLKVNEFEFSIVVSNLLDNALRATAQIADQKSRYIKIKASIVKEKLMLEVSNTYKGTLTVSEKSGLPVSKRGEGHGYGLQSVQAFAKRNNALIDYSTENGVFYIRLLL